MMHPVLKEIGLVAPSPGAQEKKQGSNTTCTALDILQQLLKSNVVTADQVKKAHQDLKRDSSSNSTSKEEKKEKAAPGISTDTSAGDNEQQQQQQQQLEQQQQQLGYRTRHVALQIYYEGKLYTGLAESIGQETDKSVEREIFAALQKTRLVSSRDSKLCQYSRCGRTDKGVSAVGQVVGLRLKSAIPLNASWDEHGEQIISSIGNNNINAASSEEDEDKLPKNAQDKITVWVPPKAKQDKPKKKKKHDRKKSKTNTEEATNTPAEVLRAPTTLEVAAGPRQRKELTEYDYEKMLNNLLPDDIRVLGWCPVSKDFSARFSANTRTYRYFFLSRGLNLQAMRQGLELLTGTHDFRNFCKLNVVQISNFVRTVHHATLVVKDGEGNNNDTNDSVSSGSDGVCYFQIHGKAFLWHQIRCIVSVLFLIGRGLESPSVVTELLNVEKYPGKPSYPLATEFPLVLHGCGFPHLRMGFSIANLWTVTCHLEEQWQSLILEAARVRNCLEMLAGVKIVQRQDLVQFATTRLMERHKKLKRDSVSKTSADQGQWMALIKTIEEEEKGEANKKINADTNGGAQPALLEWQQALEWLARWKFVPFYGLRDHIHIPLLERSKGTTFEEKIGALEQSTTRRSQLYQENVAKKRKSRDVDASFYEHMLKQGGSAL